MTSKERHNLHRVQCAIPKQNNTVYRVLNSSVGFITMLRIRLTPMLEKVGA